MDAAPGEVDLRGDDAGRPHGHRVIVDSWMADTFGEAVGFAGNWARVVPAGIVAVTRAQERGYALMSIG